MKVIEVNIDSIKPYEGNPRTISDGAIEKVAASIQEFGFQQPIVADKDGVIVVGHTRHLAAQKLGLKKVPVVYADKLTDEQVKAYRLADNKTNEFTFWDDDKLLKELEAIELNMEPFGFTELASLIEEPEPFEDDFDPDTVEEETDIKAGDMFRLGRHVLMCGDSSKKEDVEKLMGGVKADLVFTDPPYGMGKESEGVANDNQNADDLLAFNKQWTALALDALKDNGSLYCWGTDESLMDIYAFIIRPLRKEKDKKRVTFRNLITWDKGATQGQLSDIIRSYPVTSEKCLFVMKGAQEFSTNADNYFEGWEPVRDYLLQSRLAMGWDVPTMKRIVGHSDLSRDHWTSKSQFEMPTRKVYDTLKAEAERQRKERGADNDAFKKEYDAFKKEYDEHRAYFDNTHDNMNDVWHFERTKGAERESAGGHATPKPIALCCRGIKSSSREGEIVLDLFGGSGSTLIACEELNRRCYMMELEPHYCQVIIDRWEAFTGEVAEKIN